MRKKNQMYSKKLIYYNLLATSPIKNIIYAMKKIKKGFLKFWINIFILMKKNLNFLNFYEKFNNIKICININLFEI